MKKVEVVGAVILNDEGKILCALRSPEMSLPNLWEFPGGKIDPSETSKETLVREIREELGCDIEVGELVEDIEHAFPNALIRLLTFEARILRGSPQPREHAELRWVPVSDLHSLEWAPADVPTVEKIVREWSKKRQVYKRIKQEEKRLKILEPDVN
jgi:8-oxo-dGTP diphosphatase